MKIHSLLDIPKQEFDTIIWDLRYQTEPVTIGGQKYCSHETLSSNQICETCGATKGLYKDLQQQHFQQTIITQLAISPATRNTIILSPKPVGDEVLLKSHLQTPKYAESVWLSKNGKFNDKIPQKTLYIIHRTDDNCFLTNQSKFIINPTMIDLRLLNLGKTALIWTNPRWKFKANHLHYFD